MRHLIVRTLTIFIGILLLSIFCLQAQTTYHKGIPDLPATPRLVNDFAGMLTPEEVNLLETKLLNFEKTSSNEVTIVTVTDLDDLEVSEFALELGRKWDIGKEKKKNGVLLLDSKNDRKINISPGYGLSGVLPDITCGRIIREYIKPNFKNQAYYKGFDEATTAIISATQGEFSNDELKPKKTSGVFTFLKIIVIIIVIILYFFFRRNSRNIYVSRRGYRYNDGGSWGGFGGFGGGGSDSGGGGFGGFGGGGGGFDGGGASGDW